MMRIKGETHLRKLVWLAISALLVMAVVGACDGASVDAVADKYRGYVLEPYEQREFYERFGCDGEWSQLGRDGAVQDRGTYSVAFDGSLCVERRNGSSCRSVTVVSEQRLRLGAGGEAKVYIAGPDVTGSCAARKLSVSEVAAALRGRMIVPVDSALSQQHRGYLSISCKDNKWVRSGALSKDPSGVYTISEAGLCLQQEAGAPTCIQFYQNGERELFMTSEQRLPAIKINATEARLGGCGR